MFKSFTASACLSEFFANFLFKLGRFLAFFPAKFSAAKSMLVLFLTHFAYLYIIYVSCFDTVSQEIVNIFFHDWLFCFISGM